MTPPIVSIILPTCNDLLYIETTIRAVCAQSFTNFELIVIDDGSSDETPVRLRSLLASDPRLRYVRQNRAGLALARNTGLDQVQGRFVAFVAAGDFPAPSFLLAMVSAAEKTAADLVICGAQTFDDGQPCVFAAQPEQIKELDGVSGLRDLLSGAIPAEIGNRLYRKETLGMLRFLPGLGLSENWEYGVRVLIGAGRLCLLSQPLYGVRRRLADPEFKHQPQVIEARMRGAQIIKHSLVNAGLWQNCKTEFQIMAARQLGYGGFNDLIHAPSINWSLYDKLLEALKQDAELSASRVNALALEPELKRWLGLPLIHRKLGRWFLAYQFRRLQRARARQAA